MFSNRHVEGHVQYAAEKNDVNAFRSESEIEYSRTRTYLPSSTIKVDDPPIRNLVCISSTSQRTCRHPYHHYRCYYVLLPLLLSARYFDSHARASPLPSLPSSSSHLSTRICSASRARAHFLH